MFGGAAPAAAKPPPKLRERARSSAGLVVLKAPPAPKAKVSDLWEQKKAAAAATAPEPAPEKGRKRSPTLAEIEEGKNEEKLVAAAVAEAPATAEEAEAGVIAGPKLVFYETGSDKNSDGVAQAELVELVEAGDVSDNTRVWCAGKRSSLRYSMCACCIWFHCGSLC